MNTVVESLPCDDPRWMAFVNSRPEATAFHHPAWAALLAECYAYRPFAMAVAGEASQLVAGLPMLDVRGLLGGRRWVSLPFTDYCPPLARDADSLAALAGALTRQRGRDGVEALEVRAALPQHDGMYASSSAVLHTLPLGADSAAVFRTFKRTQVQQCILKAERDGVTARRGQDWEDVQAFYKLHIQTRRRLGTPVQPYRFFRLFWERLIQPGLGFVVLAYHEQAELAPIAAAVFLAWNGTLVYKFSASDSRFWGLRPNNLVLWTAIRWGCENGYHTFDFGRTDMEDVGLRWFKSGWGTVERPLVYSYIGGSPPSQERGRLMRLLRPIIRHSPPIVCRLIGELFYKYAA